MLTFEASLIYALFTIATHLRSTRASPHLQQPLMQHPSQQPQDGGKKISDRNREVVVVVEKAERNDKSAGLELYQIKDAPSTGAPALDLKLNTTSEASTAASGDQRMKDTKENKLFEDCC